MPPGRENKASLRQT
uniref:Uncharacterized protein n=1 Tax=Arundo donax TaxID=35708 RepID=A0A0A9A045_ARUDO